MISRRQPLHALWPVLLLTFLLTALLDNGATGFVIDTVQTLNDESSTPAGVTDLGTAGVVSDREVTTDLSSDRDTITILISDITVTTITTTGAVPSTDEGATTEIAVSTDSSLHQSGTSAWIIVVVVLTVILIFGCCLFVLVVRCCSKQHDIELGRDDISVCYLYDICDEKDYTAIIPLPIKNDLVCYNPHAFLQDTARSSADKHEELNTNDSTENHMEETIRDLSPHIFKQGKVSDEDSDPNSTVNDPFTTYENVKPGSIISDPVSTCKTDTLYSSAMLTVYKSNENEHINVFK